LREWSIHVRRLAHINDGHALEDSHALGDGHALEDERRMKAVR
jgi:hypothetical protein